MRYVNANDENARLNPPNGALAGNDTDLTPAATTDVIASAYDQNVANPVNPAVPPVRPTTLYNIDRSGGGNLTVQGGVDASVSPNTGIQQDLGGLGFTLNPARDGGFDITRDGRGFAALADLVAAQTRLYRISLVAGGGAATPTRMAMGSPTSSNAPSAPIRARPIPTTRGRVSDRRCARPAARDPAAAR